MSWRHRWDRLRMRWWAFALKVDAEATDEEREAARTWRGTLALIWRREPRWMKVVDVLAVVGLVWVVLR